LVFSLQQQGKVKFHLRTQARPAARCAPNGPIPRARPMALSSPMKIRQRLILRAVRIRAFSGLTESALFSPSVTGDVISPQSSLAPWEAAASHDRVSAIAVMPRSRDRSPAIRGMHCPKCRDIGHNARLFRHHQTWHRYRTGSKERRLESGRQSPP